MKKPTLNVASKVANKPRPAANVRRIRPTARPPVESVLARLSPADRTLLTSLLSAPAECVYDPLFRRSTWPGSDDDLPAFLTRPTPLVADMVEDPDYVPPTEVLTARAERTLFLRFNYCRYRVMRVLHAFRGRRLTLAATRDLLHWARLADRLRGDIVRANTSLVLAMARRSRNSNTEISELVCEGNLALLRCVDKFDVSRGFKFSTYACRAILASFSRAAAKSTRYRVQFPTPYDPALERSDYLDVKRERIEHECIDELKRILFENSAALSPVERRVLNARFALGQSEDEAARSGGRRRTLDQVGLSLGVSKERVRQIQNQAMLKLRAELERRLLAAS